MANSARNVRAYPSSQPAWNFLEVIITFDGLKGWQFNLICFWSENNKLFQGALQLMLGFFS